MMTTRCLHCGVQYAIAASDKHSSLSHELVCGQCGYPLELAAGTQSTASQLVVTPSSQQLTAPVPWLVRQLSGSVFAPSNQATLERWIREGRVSRDDLLSQDGTTWQRLGNIVELAPLFGTSDPPIPAKSGLRPVTGPQPALSEPAAAEPFVSQPAALRPTSVMPRVAAQPAAPGFFMPQSVSLLEENAQRPTGPRTTKTRGTADLFDDDDTDEPTIFAFPTGAERDDGHAMRAGHNGSRWTFVVCLALGIAAAGTYVTQPPWLNRAISALRRAPVPHAVVAEVGRGYAALDKDSMASLGQAMDAFTRAGRMDYRFADAPAGLAETELAIAEQFNQAADDLNAYAQGQPKRERLRLLADANAQRGEAARHAERALTLAKEALALAPESVPANRALALYYGVRGATDKMQQPLKRARASAPNDARVLYAAGLADLSKDPNAARASFASAVHADPNFNRALYRLARIDADHKQFKEAGPRVEQILTTASDHTLAQALLQIVEPAAHAKPEAPPMLTFEAPHDPSQSGPSPALSNPPVVLASNAATPLAAAEATQPAAVGNAQVQPVSGITPPPMPPEGPSENLPVPPQNAGQADAGSTEPPALVARVSDTTPNAKPAEPAVADPAPAEAPPAAKTTAPGGKLFAPETKPASPDVPKLAAASPTATPAASAPPAASADVPVDQLLDNARALHDAHRPADALPLYEAVTRKAPSNVSGFIGMGWCQLELNDPASAKRSFERVLHISPRLADAHFGMAEALRAENERLQAVKQYRQYLAIEPGGRMAQLARQDIEDLSK